MERGGAKPSASAPYTSFTSFNNSFLYLLGGRDARRGKGWRDHYATDFTLIATDFTLIMLQILPL